MSKPNINIPAEFAVNGIKTPFSNAKIQNGFDRINPDVLAGDNLNQFIDDTYKGLNGVLELFNGCVLYDSTVTYNNKSLVFNIEDGNIELYHSLINGNIGNPLTDITKWERVNLGGGGRNVGQYTFASLPLTDAGLHLLDGTRLSGDGIYKGFVDYVADLYTENPNANYFCTETEWQASVLQYGSCGKYVYDSTLNTVRLPRVSDIIQCTTDLTALGNLIEAGLPDITGTLSSNGGGENLSATGAFKSSTNGTWAYAHTRNEQPAHSDVRFKASDSNPIYGNNTTVQPQTIQGLVYVVIATSSKTDIQVDIDEIATDLNGKADTDLTNTTNQAKILMSGMGMPSDTYIDLTLGASGTTYTAPANGYYFIDKIGNSGQYLELGVYDTNTENLLYEVSLYSSASATNLRTTIPILKNNVLKIWYNVSGSTVRFRFIYAKGSESEAQ